MKQPNIPTTRIAQSFSRAAATYDAAAELHREVARRLLARLQYSDRTPKTILDLGTGTGDCARQLQQQFPQADVFALDIAHDMLTFARQQHADPVHYVCADASALPLATQQFDLVFSNLCLQWCVDLPSVFRHVQRILKPDGIFLFTTLGPDTLYELKTCWQQIDDYTHVNRFEDMHNVGDALAHAGFIEPVMDMERLTLTYRHVRDLMTDLKNLGASNHNPSQRSGLTGKHRFARLTALYEAYRQDGVLPATYEIVYGHGISGEHKTTHPLNADGEVRIPLHDILR